MNKKRLLSALLAVSMIPALCSCGKTDSTSDGGDAIAIDPTTKTTNADEDDYSNESSDSYHSIVNGHSPKKTTTTKVTGTKISTETTTKSTAPANSLHTTPSSGNPHSNNNYSTAGNYSGYNNRPSYSGGNSSSGGNSHSGGSTIITTNVPVTTAVQHIPAPTTQVTTVPKITTQPPVEVPDEEKECTAVIDLNGKPSFTGNNVTVNGNVVTITAGGYYQISGFTFGGRICIDTASDEAVTLVLDGADIHSISGPALLVNKAKNCTIKVADGTVNSLSDNTKDNVHDGVIFSNASLRFKGSGTLNIDAGNAHGIAGNVIAFESGTYNINAIRCGLHAHNDINISGGTLTISGGAQEEKSVIYSDSRLIHSGGYVFAAGNAVTAPTASSYPYVIADLSEPEYGGSTVEMYLNGKQVKKFEPYDDFRRLMLLSPEVTVGKSFYTIINGVKSSVITIGKGQNLFSVK